MFSHEQLPISTQKDTYSCGMLAWNAIQHHFLPEKHELLSAQDINDSRLHVFLRIASEFYHTEKVSFIYQYRSEIFHLPQFPGYVEQP